MAGLLEAPSPTTAPTAGLLATQPPSPTTPTAPTFQQPVSMYDQEAQAEQRAAAPKMDVGGVTSPAFDPNAEAPMFSPVALAHGLTRSIASTELGAIQAVEGKGQGGPTPETEKLGAYPTAEHPIQQKIHQLLFGGTEPIPSLSDIAASRESAMKPSLGHFATPLAVLGTAGEAATNFLFPEDDAAMKAFSEAASKTGSENAIADLAHTHLKGITDDGAKLLAKRYAPMMDDPAAILNDLKAMSAKAKGIAKIAPEAPAVKPTASLEELQTRQGILKDILSDHPAASLAKRFNLTQSHLGGELGDIQARASARAAALKPGSAAAAREIANPTYARQLDSHVKEMGFNDLEHAQESIHDYNDMRGQLKDINDQIRATKVAKEAGYLPKGTSVGEGTQAAPKTAEEAASRYYDEVIKPKINSGGPVVLSGDDMKAHFGGDYAPEKSDMYAEANYKNVSRAIKEHPGDFTTLGGGPGSGKTEILTKDLLRNGYKGIIYDTTLSNYEGSLKLIQEARAAGKKIKIMGILPDIERARAFTLRRALRTGRDVVAKAFARGHAGFPATLKKLLESGAVKPDEVKLYDLRNVTSKEEALKRVEEGLSEKNPLDVLKNVSYNENDLLKRYGHNTSEPTTEGKTDAGISGRPGGPPRGSGANSRQAMENVETTGKAGLGEGASKQAIVDKIPLPPQIGNVISRTGEEIKAPEQFSKEITDANGGVTPPVSRGGLQPPEIEFAKGKDIAAARQATDTMDRTLEKSFPRDTAQKIKNFWTRPTVQNETALATEQTKVIKQFRSDVVKGLGIKAKTVESALVQAYGEGRMSLEELQKASPKNWENIVEAVPKFRQIYDDFLKRWNQERFEAGLKPIPRLDNYFRHFVDLGGWMKQFGFDFSDTKLPTAISGLTHNFKSQTPWASAALRRYGSTFTDDAVTGMEDYIKNSLRAIYHTDSVQRGRVFEKYLRQAAGAKPEIKLSNFADNVREYTNLVSGKTTMLDQGIARVVGRRTLGIFRAFTRRLGMNTINANLSAAITHTLPVAYLPGTTDLGSIFRGALDTALSPLQDDFTKIDGIPSGFLTRRFRETTISPTLTQKTADVLSTPFKVASEFMTRLVVASKYYEGISHGLAPMEAMDKADDYGVRLIGDRSTGSLPTFMSNKTLSALTQFQIEVNNSMHHVLHDIPYWNEGQKAKAAGTFAKLAVSLYLYNHMMNAIKGSGKGFDPIDLALTLAGSQGSIDDQSGKPLGTRLAAAGTDLAQELPFSSLPTGGQIPVLQSLGNVKNDIATGLTDMAAGHTNLGDWEKTAVDAAVPFASPVGGGVQVQKTFKGLQDWQRGYTTDAKGVPLATIPQNVPDFIKGAAFGPSAFPEVKKSITEVDSLYNAEQMQKMKAQDANTTAQNIWDDLKGMDSDKAKAQLAQLANENPDMAKRVMKAASNDQMNITKGDKMLATLGIANGARAQFIADHMQTMETDDEKKQYLAELAGKKLLTQEVLQQVAVLMKNQ